MHELYGFDEKDTKAMAAFADRVFGPYAGIAQQYLFYQMRSIKKDQ
jgi:3-methyladenine DNA glycosylase/8-oxoguanine DNA glycosylase